MKIVLFALFLISNLCCWSQKFEPEFNNSGVLITNFSASDTIVTKLDRSTVSYSGPSEWSFSPKVHAVIKGKTSNCVIESGKPFALIVRMNNNMEDPASFMRIVKLQQKKKERKMEMSSINIWTGQVKEGNNINDQQFDAKRYGASSYLIFPLIEEPGEYGLLIFNPNNKDEKPAQMLCFSVK